MTALIATTYGNGPYHPVIMFQDRSYSVGTLPFEDIQDALARAIEVADGIRASMRSPGFDEILADLP